MKRSLSFSKQELSSSSLSASSLAWVITVGQRAESSWGLGQNPLGRIPWGRAPRGRSQVGLRDKNRGGGKTEGCLILPPAAVTPDKRRR